MEACILLLKRQTVKSNIILCTSTPDSFVSDMAAKYHIDVCVNPVSQGITADWNFAYATAKTELVTLAHQDDIYKPEYTEVMLRLANQGKDPMICFSEYYEIREGRWVDASVHRNLHIKKLMLKPLCVTALQGSTWVRRRILSFGNPIGCPLVMYVKSQLPEVVFHDGFASNVDWQTWEALSRRHGRFAYVQQPFLGHRIHPEATTSKLINAGGVRSAENFASSGRRPFVGIICRFYVTSQKSKPKDIEPLSFSNSGK